MTNTVAKTISNRHIIYFDGISIDVSTAVYNYLRRRIVERDLGETVSEYVKLLYQWSLFKGHR